MPCKFGQRWILVPERSPFWMTHEKKICCKWNIQTVSCWIWAGIRTDISFLSFKFDWTHPVQQYETAERNQLPKLLTEAVRLVERNHSLPEQIERGLVMNENLFRPQFDTLKLSDKLWLMQTLATRYNLTFKELYAFSRWRQSCTTGLFEKVAGSLSLSRAIP